MGKEKKKQKKGKAAAAESLAALPVNKFELYRQWDLLPELALEAHDLLRGEHGGEIPGVRVTEETESLATVHTVTIFKRSRQPYHAKARRHLRNHPFSGAGTQPPRCAATAN